MDDAKRISARERIDAIAEIRFLTHEEGGRATPVASGYRGQFHYGGGDWDARYTFAADPAPPGDVVEAILQFLSPQAHRGRIHAGMEFRVREGSRTVALGRLTWVDESFEEES